MSSDMRLPTIARPSVQVAVVMERQARPNQWEAWRFKLIDVVPAEPAFGSAPRVLRDDGTFQRKLYPGFTVELFRDEAEGYHLNLASGAPVWFVVWRSDDEDPSVAWPETVSVSYTEAGRWLDAQERVDNVPLPADIVAWLQGFTEEHYRPEPKQRRRPQSFLAPGDRQ
ncbi:DUF3305 domain-containing protein [Aquincola sp. S2]|uniref:DUF3305 domain-containing protein n=1 Tax=Pseudaquabacterium terrae TaxID=2732868 RepID=A0ABX2EPW1_9BURK|nr:DUF3305 domain-containing protein [Aquabacterium terrae]NRF70742.1 DUF3305 domain-containing protein [Aquabacterium terrae]